jgi:RHS repeat-associated protein
VEIDASRAVIDTMTYDVYGNCSESVPSVGGRLKFAGEEFVVATGLYHDDARDYDPVLRQFISLGLGPDENPRRYDGNDPTKEPR